MGKESIKLVANNKKAYFDYFIDAYIKTMLVLVVCSLVFFYFPQVLNVMPGTVLKTSRWSYDFYGIYAKFHNAEYEIFERNIGIFWEPGMYQGRASYSARNFLVNFLITSL